MTFKRSILKIGDSLAVGIPDAFVKEWEIKKGGKVVIERGIQNKTLILRFIAEDQEQEEDE